MSRHGAGVSVTAVAALWPKQAASGAVPPALLARTIEVLGLLAGQTVTTGLLSTKVSTLTNGVLRAMAWAKWKAASVVLLLAGLAMGGGTLAYHMLPHQPSNPEQPSSEHVASRTGADSKAEPDPKKYGTVSGARKFAKTYVREHPIWAGTEPGQPSQGISRPWPSRTFEVTFDPQTHQWTVTGSCRAEMTWKPLYGADGRLVRGFNGQPVIVSEDGGGKSWEWDWKLALSYNPSARGYEVHKAEGLDMDHLGSMRPARMDDYGRWLQGKFTKPGRSADLVTALRLVLDVPEQTKYGLKAKYSYGKGKIAAEPTPRGASVSIGDPAAGGQAERWTLLFEAAVAHSLKVGEYGGASYGGWCVDVGPLVRVAHCPVDGGKQTWNSVFGEFVVWEIELQDKKVNRLAIDFITDTEYGLPSTAKRDSRHILRGSLRFNSQFEPSIPGLDRDAAE
jgi:hypothetical protein